MTARNMPVGRPQKSEVSMPVRASSPAAGIDSPRDDRQWKALTGRANAAFAAQRWRDAERLYRDALAEADVVFRAYREGRPVGDADPAPMLVVAVANLAECLLCGNCPGRAGAHLVALRDRLCEAIESAAAPQHVREQCFIHLRRAVVELADKLPRAGFGHAQTAREIEKAKTVALAFLAHHTSSQ